MDTRVWAQVGAIRQWLDKEQEGSPRELRMARVLKVGEEFGEVVEALHGVLGLNPRKGFTHSWDDVRDELVDVAVSALVALETIAGDPEGEFAARLGELVARLPAAEERP